MSDAPLAEAFEAYFDYSLARGDEQEEIHRLRYDVYCREFGFEREEDCPGGWSRMSSMPSHGTGCSATVARDGPPAVCGWCPPTPGHRVPPCPSRSTAGELLSPGTPARSVGARTRLRGFPAGGAWGVPPSAR